ncbi:ABC transporter ATP-binding protein [Paenibacillus woosongensis]|uniref:ATP-binding cassette domain-containing protein n=1 Tax=Paenibacillus woosongensis TaxID=307580 RepID=A0A7X2Z3H0_9BACL|nr:ABC transporter ATP-binding protein [Paenibacillus woosongensis]MUG46878.1 ATP-binding cassette domain-containing protein [Paenibacillus woosongensis]
MNYLIQADGLTKVYKKRHVIRNISLTIYPGEVIGIIGPNGAGKSTTLDLLLGLRRPDQGTVTYGHPELYRRIGVQLQSTPFFPGYSALENMRLFAAFYGVRLKTDAIMSLLAQCGLEEAARTDAFRLSGGQQKRLAIAMTLVHDPSLVFLDEPTAALDPRARREIRELIALLAKSGTSVVFTSHDMEEVYKLATRIVMIDGGILRADGRPEDLLNEYGASGLEELYVQLTEPIRKEEWA